MSVVALPEQRQAGTSSRSAILRSSGSTDPELGRLGVPGRPVPSAGRSIDGRLVDAVFAELLEDERGLEVAVPVFLGLAVPVDPGEEDLVLQGQLAGGLVDDGPQDVRGARRGPGRRVLGGDGAEEKAAGGDEGEGGGGRDAFHGASWVSVGKDILRP